MISIPQTTPPFLNAIPLVLTLVTLLGCNAKVEVGSTVNPNDQGEEIIETNSEEGTIITDSDELKRLGFPDLADITVHQKGDIQPRETVAVTVEADTAQALQLQTNVFFAGTEWKEGDTIELVQTNAPDKKSVLSEDGILFNQIVSFTPVDGRIILELENKSDHSFYFELYQDK